MYWNQRHYFRELYQTSHLWKFQLDWFIRCRDIGEKQSKAVADLAFLQGGGVWDISWMFNRGVWLHRGVRTDAEGIGAIAKRSPPTAGGQGARLRAPCGGPGGEAPWETRDFWAFR